jgi:CRP/FNR family transcriptional regulator, cyclic AMP receptor protein
MDREIKAVVKKFFDTYPLAHYDKGEIILRPEEDLVHVFYLVSGQVVEYDISSAGNEVIVNAFKPGAFFPMSMAINHTPNYYFFEAASPITVRQAPVEDVVAFLKTNSDVTFDLLSRVYLGTDGLLRRMAHLMGGKTKSRLVFELLNGAARFGEKKSDGVFIPLTENDISKRSGLSRETISRAMRELKTDHLVSVQPRGILIPDITRLEAVIGHEL